MGDAVRCDHVGKRLGQGCAFDDGVNFCTPPIGQEDRTRLRPELADVAGPVVFLFFTSFLVLQDFIGIIFVNRAEVAANRRVGTCSPILRR